MTPRGGIGNPGGGGLICHHITRIRSKRKLLASIEEDPDKPCKRSMDLPRGETRHTRCTREGGREWR